MYEYTILYLYVEVKYIINIFYFFFVLSHNNIYKFIIKLNISTFNNNIVFNTNLYLLSNKILYEK